MAVAFDAVTSGVPVGGTTLAFTGPSVGGSNRIVVVGVAWFSLSGVVVDTVVGSVNGSYTKVPSSAAASPDTFVHSELWYFLNPAIGAETITITLSGSDGKTAGAISMTGVHQTTPLGTAATNGGSSTGPTVDVIGASDDLIVDGFSVDNTTTSKTAGGGQEKRWERGAVGLAGGAGSTEPGTASVTMSWTLGTTSQWAISGVAIKAAAGAAPAPIPASPLVSNLRW